MKVRNITPGCLVLALLCSSMVEAATITVDTTDDELNADGNCSLREAVTAANTDTAVSGCAAGSGPDEIVFAVDGTFLLSIAGTGENDNATGDLDVREALTLAGNGIAATVIDAEGIDRVVETSGADLTIRDLTIQGGDAAGGFGGGINHDGDATLTLRDCLITNNRAGDGGGINNNQATGMVDIARCTVSDNVAEFGFAGGINNNSDGDVSLTDCEISGNQATSGDSGAFGGGINNNLGGALTVMRCAIVNNASNSPRGGGGIHNNSDGTVDINQSEIAGNTAVEGAGLNNNSSGSISVVNSTVSGNVATGGDGGGGLQINGSGSVDIAFSTIAANEAPSAGGIFDSSSSGEVILESTIVAGNNGGDCVVADIVSSGENIDSDGSCALASASDKPSTDPLLGPLADNGGPTRTHALGSGSPALSMADSSVCPATDQRGIARPMGAGCDIGALESEAEEEVTPVAKVPTLSEWAWLLLTGLLVFSGAILLRRGANNG